MLLGAVCALACLAGRGLAAGRMGGPIPDHKKLIAFATNSHAASPAYLRQNVAEMEKRLPLDGLVIGEVALSLYSLLGAGIAFVNGHQFAVPFILMYAFGFGYVGLQGLWDARRELWRWLTSGSAEKHEAKPLPSGVKLQRVTNRNPIQQKR